MDSSEPKYLKRNMLAIYGTAALLAISFWIGHHVGYVKGAQQTAPSLAQGQVHNTNEPVPAFLSKDVNFDLYWQVWNVLKQHYLRTPFSDTKLFYGSLEGMVAALGDPYTVFFNPDTNKKFNQELSGKFDGIGAEIGMKNQMITVIAPLPDSPATKAGIRAGDQIIAIDGVDTSAMTVDEAVSRIRGKKDTTVTLTIVHADENTRHDFTITRAQITVHSVKEKFLPENIAMISVSEFGGDTNAEFDRAVQETLVKNPRGIILDLRNNPGGFLETAVSMAGEWITPGKVVVVQQNQERQEFVARGRARFAGIPTIVLVNGGSASASEILSGALQDYHFATLVGTQTFGKGSVQDVENFDDGSAVKYTIAEWLTPLGRSINKVGITPDVVVPVTEADITATKDPQLTKAIELLTTKK